jgi:hypothetical protein
MRVERIEPGLVAPDVNVLRTRTFRWLLREVLKRAVGATFADLGAGPCVFSRIARDLGYRVTAVDVRDERVPRDLVDIAFVKSDVRAYSPEGHDVIAIVGLLYHLTLEDQLDLLSRCPLSSTLIIDTQVHIPELVVRESNRAGFADRIVTQGPYSGVIYPELDNPMASWGNASSFWHTEPSLLSLLENTGRSWIRIVDPPYVSKYGARTWLVADSSPPAASEAT